MRNLSLTAFAELVAAKSGLPLEQVRAVFQAQASVAHEQVASGTAVPIEGLGVFERLELPGRSMVMMFGPNKGRTISTPPSHKLKFVISTAAKAAILGPVPPPPETPDFDEVDSDGEPGDA